MDVSGNYHFSSHHPIFWEVICCPAGPDPDHHVLVECGWLMGLESAEMYNPYDIHRDQSDGIFLL